MTKDNRQKLDELYKNLAYKTERTSIRIDFEKLNNIKVEDNEEYLWNRYKELNLY